MVNFKSIACLLALGLSSVAPQETLFTAPTDFWANQILPSDGSDGGVFKGNGCKLTPDGGSLIVTSVGGTVTSFNAFTGAFQWEYQPPQPENAIVRSHSQVVFTTPNAVTPPYMVYAVVENENSADAVTRVIALDIDGNELWVSDTLDGIASGSPVVSDDGSYVFLTHNANFETMGYFTALFAPGDGALFYSRSNETTPFAPLGIYHSPIEGNYDGEEGRGNTNDMIMWSMSPKPTDTTINDGHTFGFQFPVGFDGNVTEVGYFLLGLNPRAFQAKTAPTLTNQGLYAYFSTSRSGFFGWNGNAENGRGRFNRGPQAVAGFDRNPLFAGEPVFASPVVSSSPDAPFVFCGTASTQFVRLSFDFVEQVVVSTTALIKAEARVDPFDRVVYYAEESGMLHQANFNDLTDAWSLDLGGAAVEGEMALNKNGYILYVADSAGFIRALQLSEIPVTPSPTAGPSGLETAMPTASPVVATTDDPTSEPSAAPFAAPTDSTPAPTGSTGATPVPTASVPTGGSGASQPMMLLSVAALAFCLLF